MNLQSSCLGLPTNPNSEKFYFMFMCACLCGYVYKQEPKTNKKNKRLLPLLDDAFRFTRVLPGRQCKATGDSLRRNLGEGRNSKVTYSLSPVCFYTQLRCRFHRRRRHRNTRNTLIFKWSLQSSDSVLTAAPHLDGQVQVESRVD